MCGLKPCLPRRAPVARRAQTWSGLISCSSRSSSNSTFVVHYSQWCQHGECFESQVHKVRFILQQSFFHDRFLVFLSIPIRQVLLLSTIMQTRYRTKGSLKHEANETRTSPSAHTSTCLIDGHICSGRLSAMAALPCAVDLISLSDFAKSVGQSFASPGKLAPADFIDIENEAYAIFQKSLDSQQSPWKRLVIAPKTQSSRSIMLCLPFSPECK